jgi:ribosomal protein S18 acetylase RimI-like enzyme
MASFPSSRQDVTVRAARVSDLAELVRFSAAMAEETERRTLDLERLRQGISAVLTSKERGYYLVAETMSRVVGQLLITYEWSDWRNGVFWWIQSVYVEPAMREGGVYRTMHDYVLQEAQRRPDVCGIRLYVEKDNVAAQAAYRRLGMRMTDYHVFEQDFVL